MKNTLGDLNNHLFVQLEKLNDDDLAGEQLEAEIKRTEAMAKISEQIIRNGELQFKAMQHMDEYGYERKKLVPEMLEVRGVPVRKKEKQNAAAERNYQQFNEIQGILQKIENILYGREVIKSGDEKAIDILERISRGWLPNYNFSGEESDFENYCLHQAIYRAQDALRERTNK